MATSISAILVPCLKSFNQLQEQVERPGYGSETEVSSASWTDELGRLRVWAANIGAHQTGQSSLDFRLRDASHISKQITKLLRDLEQSLHDIFDELSEDETEASGDDWPDDESTTELQQLHEEVVNIIDCLYQLSMLIRKPAQHDLLVGSRMGDKAEYEFYDKEHVRNLHPKTEEQIGQRLGRAITRRRKYLFYRERHHRKLEKGIEEVQGIQRTTTESVMSETIATDFKTPNIDFEETSSDSGISQTSYAPSLIDGGRLTIPPPPRDSVGGKPFECPYCFFVIDVKSTRSWNRHIFKDIKPYVCTFSECSMPDRLYDSRREWYFHEITEHRREDFVCPLCKETLKSSKQYERHVARHLEELALFALPRTEMDDAEDDNDDAFNARASTSESNVGFDSPSEGSSVKEDEWRLDVLNRMGRTEDPPSSSGTPTHSEPTISENALERERYSEGPLEPYSAHEIHGTPDHESAPYKNLSPIPTSMSSLQRAEAGVATAIGEANREHQLAAEKDETGATAKSSPPAEEKDKDIKFIKFVDAIGRRFRFSFHLVKTWSGMEHMIKETFLLVPNLNLRVADGEYDLFGPQEEILSPSNWESMIEPDWEITMRMWPNPERPPWEDASPMAMLQARDNFRAGKEDERLKCSIPQQEQNVSYRNSEPSLLRGPRAYSEDASPMAMLRARNNFRAEKEDERLKRSIPQQEQNAPYRNSEPLLFRDPGAYRRERPATYVVGDVGIEERRPRTWNELRPYTTEKPTTELDAVRRHRERNTDDLPLGRRADAGWQALEGGTQHESDTVRRRGSEVEDPQAKEPSDEAGWVPIPRPFQKGAPFGPYHHVRGGR